MPSFLKGPAKFRGNCLQTPQYISRQVEIVKVAGTNSQHVERIFMLGLSPQKILQNASSSLEITAFNQRSGSGKLFRNVLLTDRHKSGPTKSKTAPRVLAAPSDLGIKYQSVKP
jgi:hypothetical protein